MKKCAGFTIVPYESIPYAEVLAFSFIRHHPDAQFFIVVLDYSIKVPKSNISGVTYLTSQDLMRFVPDYLHLVVALDRAHLIQYLQPRVAEHLAENFQILFCMEPKVNVYSPLAEMTELLDQSEISVVPRRLTPFIQDGLSPSEEEVLKHGFYSSGVMGINCESMKFIDWWKSVNALTEQLSYRTGFGFLDSAVPFFKSSICNSPNYGLAYWNLDERDLLLENQVWKIGNSDLAYAYFDEFDVRYPYWVSNNVASDPRIRVSSSDILRLFYSSYSEEVIKFRRPVSDLPVKDIGDDFYEWDVLIPGVGVTPGVRHVFRNELLNSKKTGDKIPPTPFAVNHLSHFLEWLEEDSVLSTIPMQRFVLAVLIDRRDLLETFIHEGVVDYPGIERWIIAHGRCENPLSWLMTLKIPPKESISDEGRSLKGVDVIGSLNSEHGLGEAGRLLVEALKTTEEKVSTISFSPFGIRGKHTFSADNQSRNELTVVALNPEQFAGLWKGLGGSLKTGRYVIGQWFWELEVAPPWYQKAFQERIVDELWAPTRFIEDMLRSCVPHDIVVRYMPLPLIKPTCRPDFSLATVGLEEKFSFLFTFDFNSVMKRKNPDGTIEAFKRAFSPNEGPQLIVKSINGHLNAREFEKLRWACDGRNDIVLLDRHLDSKENASLMAVTDCYVSLHRAEGLGLTIAEAMLLEKPVIATAYSGNMDFMDEDSGLLVPWEYTSVGSGANAYPAHAQWAEPDIDVASNHMRWVFENQSEAQAIGQRAKGRVLRDFSPAITGERMHNRLKEIRRNK
jgi:glycosyltransferase involved in cell wall biosynthesis